MTAPPPSLITQQSSRCSGSAIIGELTTSSTVTTSRSIACGLCCAWCEAATLTQASCSLVVPNSCMCRIAHIAYRFAVVGADGNSKASLGHARTADARRRPGRHALGARPAGQRDQRDAAFAGRDRRRGVRDMDQVGRAAGVGRIDVPQPAGRDSRPSTAARARRVAGAEIAVDVVLASARHRPARRCATSACSCGDRLVRRPCGSDARRRRRYRRSCAAALRC